MERNDTLIPTGQSGQGADHYGMSNIEYDIVTTLSNLLQGHEALSKYAADADQAGDGDTATIFRMLQESNRSAVVQLRNALARHISSVSPSR